MVGTRRKAAQKLKEQTNSAMKSTGHESVEGCPVAQEPKLATETEDNERSNRMDEGSVKTEGHNLKNVSAPPSATGRRSTGRSMSSIQARKKRLELEAAEAKARIQLDLIDKQLKVNLAELDEYSPNQSKHDANTNNEVEKWLERSRHEQEETTHPQLDSKSDDLCPPPPCGSPPSGRAAAAGTDDGTVQMLASALKDLAAATTAHGSNTAMLSRLSTPRDLPAFSGDPLEWLNFKEAFESSTRVCNFNEQENIWRLRKCLHGAAKDAVSALLISATSTVTVMSTLELLFGNPDVIISKVINDIKRLHPMSQDYHKDIVIFSVKVKNYVAAVLAVGKDEYLQGTNVLNIILSKIPAVLISKWSDYSYPLINNKEKPRLVILSEFLNEEAVKISKTSANLVNNPSDKRSYYVKPHPQTVLVQQNNNEKCGYCRASVHKLPDCKQFKRSLRKDRWRYVKRNGICYQCLESTHKREICKAPMCDKDGCGQAHHRLMHYPMFDDKANNNDSVNNPALPMPQSTCGKSDTVTHIKSNCRILLKVVPITIHGPRGAISTTALLDDGSTVTIMSETLASSAGLRGRRETIRARGAWDHSGIEREGRVFDLKISNQDGIMFNIRARSVEGLSIPTQTVPTINYEEYEYMRLLQGKIYHGFMKPQLLIGQDNYHLIQPLEIKSGKPCEPFATLTPLGWCVHGHLPVTSLHDHALMFVSDQDASARSEEDGLLRELHEEVRRSFSIDAIGIFSAKPRQNSDDLRALNRLEQTVKLVDGRWHVGLPWRNNQCKLPDSYSNALVRLKSVERKMKINEEYAHRYKERINHLLVNDYAEELKSTEHTDKTWYLPHFGVDNPNKKKIRLVFDAAARSDGMCLNDYLLKGPDLLESLFGIMLRFRENKVAVTADIRDMFLRTKIISDDRDAFRFLWRDNPTSDVKVYVMTSLIFGANCSPFIAQFVKNKNAQQYLTSMPVAAQQQDDERLYAARAAAVNAICKQHYVDDYIDSIPTEEAAIELIKNIIYIHKQGGLEICNWASNSEAVLSCLPTDLIATNAVKFKVDEQYEGQRTLGLLWYPSDDTLCFDVSLKKIPESLRNGSQKPTKRELLRIVMSIFDVYGFLSPYIICGRILLQETWRYQLQWDQLIPDSVHKKWKTWIGQLKSIGTIRIPRWYKSMSASEIEVDSANASQRASTSKQLPTSYTNLQLHMFCDASTKAMCTVAFWRWTNNNEVYVSFIASKCRVAPVRPITVPRLELQAAVLAARLSHTIQREQLIKPEKVFYWTDSSTILYWIRNSARSYKTFVAHRLGEIDELTNVMDWKYVPTDLNVADLATRDNYESVLELKEWFQGPRFLYEYEKEWPADVVPEIKKEEEESLEIICTINKVDSDLPVPCPTRFSSWLRLLRATASVLKFIDKCRKTESNESCNTMEKAEHLLLRYCQAQTFGEEISAIKNRRLINRNSKLLTLSPVLGEDGLLRLGGRIDAASGIPLETKRPVILHGQHPVTRLLVRHYHVSAAHGNQETVVNELKQKYWVIKMRPTVKTVTSQCFFCRIRKARPEIPRMGDLPEARLAHHQRPFTFCGLDLFGPMEVTVGRHREKRYGVLFTCLTVRAIHVEVVNTLTTDSLIMALRRMAARRGWPRHLYSDNGTNLRGADTELRKSIDELNKTELQSQAENRGTKWTFIPAASPHWGGAWERLIRSVKTALKAILKERAPRDEVLNTLLTEIENLVNGRPLTHVSIDPTTNESLTPNHFLLGTSNNLPVQGKFDDSDPHLRRQWRVSQALVDAFWRRWVKEVLPTLLPRQKWNQEERPLQVGDLVFLADSTAPRNVWPRGVIEEVLPGRDGRVRMVVIKTRTGRLTRSASRVVRLPTMDN